MKHFVSRLSNVLAGAEQLPRRVVEPTTLALLGSSVIGPAGVLAADTRVARPRAAQVVPGGDVVFNVSISDGYGGPQGAASDAVAYLAGGVDVDAVLEQESSTRSTCSASASSLTTRLSYQVTCSSEGCARVSVACPPDALVGSVIVIQRVVVDGVPLPGPPWTVRVSRGLAAPFDIVGKWTQVCVTSDGVLLATGVDNTDGAPFLASFASDGTPLPDARINLQSPQLLSSAAHAGRSLCYDESTGVVLMGRKDSSQSERLLAVDAAGCSLRWLSTEGCKMIWGFAVLPAQRVVFVSDYAASLHVHSLDDGSRLDTSPCHWAAAAASDTAAGIVYVSRRFDDLDKVGVSVWRWDDAARKAVCEPEPLEAAGLTIWSCGLAVIPAPAGSTAGAFLVTSTDKSNELRVVSLATRTLVHTHTFEKLHLNNMTSDPTGTSLIIISEGTVHVFAWPLPGMAPL
jgi:hypothetical protein